ncbi:hypothetical protein D3C75_1153180 [compost metagenome]
MVPAGTVSSTWVSAGTFRKVAAPLRRSSMCPSLARLTRLIFSRAALNASFNKVRAKPSSTPVSRSVKMIASAVAA